MRNPLEWHYSIFGHPHHYAASIVTKLVTCGATVWWAVRVLLDPSSMSTGQFSYYAWMLRLFPAWGWASIAIALSLFAMYRLWAKSPPMLIGGVGYLILAGFWIYLAFAINFLVPAPVPPAGAAAIGMVAIVSLFAWATNPRTRNGDPTS